MGTHRLCQGPGVAIPVGGPRQRRSRQFTCAAQVAEDARIDWRDLIVKFSPHEQRRVCTDLLRATIVASVQLCWWICGVDSPDIQRNEDITIGVTAWIVTAPPQAPPVVILPGFGNRSSDYECPFGEDSADNSLVSELESRGFQCHVVPVLRKDWLRVALGITSLDFWRSGLTTHPSYSWYLQRVKDTVRAAIDASGGEQVILVGHSAGGWLGRAFLGDSQWFVGEAHLEPDEWVPGPGTCSPVPNPAVRAIVTLGTPQRPPPADLGRDMTGGAQSWVDTNYAGAFYTSHGVSYVCVGGKTVTGRQRDKKNKAEQPTPPSYAFNAYTQVCGEGEGVIGDAVVPLQSMFLDGADNVELPGVFHSMSRIGTYDSPGEYPWYGSPEVVDLWLERLVKALEAEA